MDSNDDDNETRTVKQQKKSRKERKEEGRILKRQRIEASGGVRPRNPTANNKKEDDEEKQGKKKKRKNQNKSNNATTTMTMTTNINRTKNQHHVSQQQHQPHHHHRFGQVMDQVPCRNKPRFSTLSIALPGSVLSNCQTRELKTHLVGQIARACTLYHVDEIIVFDDKLGGKGGKNNNHHRDGRRGGRSSVATSSTTSGDGDGDDDGSGVDPSCAFMARVLQYCECPQYLRRNFFPHHNDLQFAGLLPPIDAPHHVRAEDRCRYREGVVLDPNKKNNNKQQQQQQSKEEEAKEDDDDSNKSRFSSLVNCGVRSRPFEIDRKLPVGIRCTVQVDPKDYGRPGKRLTGKVVSPSTPREENGMYWGYTTRIANSIQKVFEDCPFDGGKYDLKIGTSERGDVNIEDPNFVIPKFQHTLIVFGGIAGIEECVDADETTRLPGSESKKLFELWVNVCPFQGSRTIRTEEAVLISLAKLSPHIAANGVGEEPEDIDAKVDAGEETAVVDFSDEAISEESSDGSSSSSSNDSD